MNATYTADYAYPAPELIRYDRWKSQSNRCLSQVDDEKRPVRVVGLFLSSTRANYDVFFFVEKNKMNNYKTALLLALQ